MALQLEEERLAPPSRTSLLPKGCWIALIIFAVLTVFTLIGLAIVIYAIAQNPEVQRVARVVGSSVRLAQEAQNAPGAREVRSLGCANAYVMDAERLAELARELDNQVPDPDPNVEGNVVMCQVLDGRPPPSCLIVAQTYIAAVPSQPRNFTVIVQSTSHQSQQCSARFDPSGRLLEQFTGGAALSVPNLGRTPTPPSPAPTTPAPDLPPLPLQPNPYGKAR